ncbi:MAG: GerAB/ArcD/ProY family transporter [Thermoanaerobacteraceae bacterium]|nr:GerAB/ArcD/ProY family transporter [Thermoanaerobacteraceae bacterium]
MISEGRVDQREAATLVVASIVTEIFLTLPALLVDEAQTAAWMVLLVTTVVGMVAFLPMAALMERFPGKSIIEAGEEVLGPVLNGFFSLAYLSFFLVTTVVVLRQFAERTLTVAIPELPLSVAIAGMLAGGMAACSLGLEAMARSTWVMMYFMAPTMLLVNLLPYPYWRVEYLVPFWGAGPGEMLVDGFWRSSLMGEVLFLCLVAPALKEQSVRGPGLVSIMAGGLTMVLSMVAMQIVFPVGVLREMALPSFEMSRLIYFGRFVQRLETLFMPLWALAGMIKVTIGCYACAVIITRALKLPYHRPFLLPVTVILFAAALIPVNVSQTVWLDTQLVRRWGWIPSFLLPALLFLVALARGKGEKRQGGKKQGGHR